MAELKTRKTNADVNAFIDRAEPAEMRNDCLQLIAMMSTATGSPPRMWGPAIVGFGTYHYKYASGREGDWFITGFSPRKQNISLYIMSGFEGYGELMSRLGKHSTGKSCLYVKRLSDIDIDVLEELITKSVNYMQKRYPDT